MRPRRLRAVAAAATAVVLSLPVAAHAALSANNPAPRSAAASAEVSGRCDASYSAVGGTKATECLQLKQQPLTELSAAQATVVRQAVTRFSGSTLAAGTPPTPPAQCSFTQASENSSPLYLPHPDRFTSCIATLHIATLYASDGTTVVGNYQFADLAWASFSVSSVHWTHGLWVIPVPVSNPGQLAGGVSGSLFNGCGPVTSSPTQTICTATGIDGTPASTNPLNLQLTPNSGYKLTWDESDTGAAGAVDILDDTIGEFWLINGIPNASGEAENLPGSCDYEGSTLGAAAFAQGCVDERYVPTLVLPRSQYGSAATMIQWAQNNLQSHWGLHTGPGEYDGNPLRRMYNPDQASANRGVICPRSFPTLPGIGAPFDTDSCDEYPFAATYESGATVTGLGPAVTSGNQCVQATAQKSTTGSTEPQVWNGIILGANAGNTFANCIRGHIPLIENSDVGTAYSTLIRTNRVLDNDPFWIAVTQ